MLGKQADPKCKQGITNVEAQYDILHDESFQSESKFVSDKNMLILKDYETDRSSKRNFYLIANNIPDNQLGEVGSRRVSEKTESSGVSSFEKPESVRLDTVRSGESLIKHFNFDTSKYNSDTDKCVAFWRTLTQTGLKPVKCTLLKGGKSSVMLKQEEEESSDYDSCMWYKALEELQRRKMDEAAFTAIPQQCKLCGQEEPYAKFKNKQGGKYSESELKDYEDLTSLNYWNPNEKQIAVSKLPNMQQHQQTKVLELPAMAEQLEPPSLITVEEEDKTSTYSKQEAEEKCEIGQQHTITLSQSDPCRCGRRQCLCNDSDISDELHNMKRSESDPCKCGRTHCLCNECDELSQEVETVNFLLSVESQEATHTEHTEKDTADKTDIENALNENLSMGMLPKCEICKTYCKCWDHKIEMSKQFIDESRYQLKYRESKQDKSCETENVIEEKDEVPKKFCIICGHSDCNCNGPHQKKPQKYFQYIEFEDTMITTLLLKKDQSLREVKSLTNAEKISRSAFQNQIYEHSREDICCTKQKDEISGSKQEEIKTINKVVSTKNVLQQKILITPEQRAKDITNRNRVILKPDKYGIPQLVRYADGHLAPKPSTSQDILSSDNSDHDG